MFLCLKSKSNSNSFNISLVSVGNGCKYPIKHVLVGDLGVLGMIYKSQFWFGKNFVNPTITERIDSTIINKPHCGKYLRILWLQIVGEFVLYLKPLNPSFNVDFTPDVVYWKSFHNSLCVEGWTRPNVRKGLAILRGFDWRIVWDCCWIS